MTLDAISLIIRILICFFLAVVSQLALEIKNYSLSLFTLSIWVTIFRSALLRATSNYVGLFSHDTASLEFYQFLRGSQLTNLTDGFILIATIYMLFEITKYYRSYMRRKVRRG